MKLNLDFLFTDKSYQSLIEEYNLLLKGTYDRARGGYSDSFINDFKQNKIARLETLVREWSNEYIDKANEKLNEIEESYRVADLEPNQEILKRQNFDVKMELMDVDEFNDFISKEPKLSTYEYAKVKQKFNQQNENTRDRLRTNMAEIEHNYKEPARNDKDYIAIKKNAEMVAGLDMHRNGKLWLPESDGNIKQVDIFKMTNKVAEKGKQDFNKHLKAN